MNQPYVPHRPQDPRYQAQPGAQRSPVPQQAQPRSAWAEQPHRVQAVAQQKQPVPVMTIVTWVIAGLLGVGLLLVLAVGLISTTLSTGRVGEWFVFAILALVSLLVIIGVVVLADRWEPEPVRLLLIAVFWGGAVAATIALIVNVTGIMALYVLTGDASGSQSVYATFGAPIVEETSKGLGLVFLLLIARRHFNGPLDGLVYGALIGGGFAFVENISYYMEAASSGGLAGGLVNVFVRGVIGIFGHAIYTSLTGVIMGLVVRRWGMWPGVLVFLVAPWPGMLLHGLWNGGTAVMQAALGGAGLLLMLLFEMLESALWLGLIILLVWDESKRTRASLADYAKLGWLTPDEVTMLATWHGRREGRRWARSINATTIMKKMIQDATALGSVRQRILADGAKPNELIEQQTLLTRLTEYRRALLAANGAARRA